MVELEEVEDTTTNEFISIVNLDDNGGVVKKIIENGDDSGELPQTGQEIIAHYEGRLLDGTIFDSSYKRSEPFKFVLGQGQVIKTWDMGFATMKKGEKSLLVGQPEFCYGENGSPPTIPPNSVLEFKVELIDFKDKKKERWEMSKEEKLEQALMLKEEGTQLLKNQQYQEAFNSYKNAIDYINDESDLDDQKLSIYLNLSLAANKMNQWMESNLYSKSALEIDDKNIKALYRNGISNHELSNLDEAMNSFNKILEVEPDNKLVHQKIRQVTNKKIILTKKTNKMFSNMFGGLDYGDVTNTVDEETNNVDEETNTVDDETNTVDEETNTVDEETNTVDEETNTVDEETNTVDEETSKSNDSDCPCCD